MPNLFVRTARQPCDHTVVDNAYVGPTDKSEDHASVKPVDMLSYFFKMFIDEMTRLAGPGPPSPRP